MPTINDRYVGPPKRMLVRIVIAVAFVVAVALYAAHVEGQKLARAAAAAHALSLVTAEPTKALNEAVVAHEAYGDSPDNARALWAALMAGGGKHGTAAMVKWTFAYTPRDPRFSLMFSNDSRFLAAIDGNTITVWNTETGEKVLETQGGDRFIGYWRIGARHFGLFASYQYYDLVNSVIELPDGYRYAQPSKDSLTAVAPGGDWAYRVPDAAPGRTDYPIKLVNLHSGEKREVDVSYAGTGAVAVNSDATRVAAEMRIEDMIEGGIWNARTRNRIATMPGGAKSYYMPQFLDAAIFIAEMNNQHLTFYSSHDESEMFQIRTAGNVRSVADDAQGLWFSIAMDHKIKLYRGVNSPVLSIIAKKEVSPAPATSH